MQQAVLERLAFMAELVPEGHLPLQSATAALNYSELNTAIMAQAAWLAAQPSAVVAILADNSIPWVVADLACMVAGKVSLPIPPFFSPAQIQHCLQQTACTLLLTDNPNACKAQALFSGQNIDTLDFPTPTPGHSPRLSALTWSMAGQAAVAMPENTSKITYTSGSTGAPKGVCLSLAHQWQVAESLAETIRLTGPKHLCLLPLATLLENLAGVYAPLLSGGSVLLLDGVQRGLTGSTGLDLMTMVGAISQAQPNSMILIPQLLIALIIACERGWQVPASLQFVAVGGGRVAPELIAKARSCGIPVFEGYGLSECGSVVALNTAKDDQPGSVGRVLPHCHVDIREQEIFVRGATFLGYLNDPHSWQQSEVATGDLGALDNGRLTIFGRKKNLIITNFGRNISPEWVESEIQLNPAIGQCVVVGDGRPFLGALLASGLSDAEIDQWLHHVNQKLPDYARVCAWQRVAAEQWPQYLTDNGRPRRAEINRGMAAEIDQLYAQATAKVGNLS